MQGGIERFSGLKDAKDDINELSHHGSDNKHGLFSGGCQTAAEALARHIRLGTGKFPTLDRCNMSDAISFPCGVPRSNCRPV